MQTTNTKKSHFVVCMETLNVGEGNICLIRPYLRTLKILCSLAGHIQDEDFVPSACRQSNCILKD
jgi:hypothetical protein